MTAKREAPPKFRCSTGASTGGDEPLLTHVHNATQQSDIFADLSLSRKATRRAQTANNRFDRRNDSKPKAAACRSAHFTSKVVAARKPRRPQRRAV
jgi:hypothetical protein